ncbi:MAG: hypothetical protein PHI34_10910 [Acidobacteriota bacterium]|nr:hypothetical protein [Acidobacteriota bacterium]
MNHSERLAKLERVFAPADFEDRVLAALAVRKREMPARRRALLFRRAAAGSAAVLLAGLAALNLFVLRGPSSSAILAGSEAGLSDYNITEPVDYRSDLQTAANSTDAVYILERVSEASHTLIKY